MFDYNKIEKEFLRVMDYAQKNLESLLENAKNNCCEEKYLIGASFLGPFDPSLILKFLVDGYKKGKILNSLPNKNCNVIWLDKNQKLLYLFDKHLNPKFDHESYLRVEFDGYEYYLYMFDNKFATYAASFRTKYIDGRPVEHIYYSNKERINVATYSYRDNHVFVIL